MPDIIINIPLYLMQYGLINGYECDMGFNIASEA